MEEIREQGESVLYIRLDRIRLDLLPQRMLNTFPLWATPMTFKTRTPGILCVAVCFARSAFRIHGRHDAKQASTLS